MKAVKQAISTYGKSHYKRQSIFKINIIIYIFAEFAYLHVCKNAFSSFDLHNKLEQGNRWYRKFFSHLYINNYHSFFNFTSPENMRITFLLTRSNTGRPTALFYAPMANKIQNKISSVIETGRFFYTFEN